MNNQQDKVEFNSESENILKEIIQFTMKKEGIDEYEIGVTLVDDSAILELNKKYRNINQPTDVLSFPLSDEGDNEVIGDIVISLETAKRQAVEYNHSFLRETAYLLIHGIYHILGYTHDEEEDQKAMRIKEEEVLNHFNILR